MNHNRESRYTGNIAQDNAEANIAENTIQINKIMSNTVETCMSQITVYSLSFT
jgi:hypothetical protein